MHPTCLPACCLVVLSLQEAQAARVQTDGYKLDKNHTFKVSMFDDFDRYAKVTEEYQTPDIKAYTPMVSRYYSLSVCCHDVVHKQRPAGWLACRVLEDSSIRGRSSSGGGEVQPVVLTDIFPDGRVCFPAQLPAAALELQ